MPDWGCRLPLLRWGLQSHSQPAQPRLRRGQVDGSQGKKEGRRARTVRLSRSLSQDGKISLTEGRILGLLGLTSSVVVLCDLIVVIWVSLSLISHPAKFSLIPLWQGSVVVFSNYSSWTYTDHSSDNFCEKTPMVFAFSLLLIKWLLLPAILILGCITALCCPSQRNNDGQSQAT